MKNIIAALIVLTIHTPCDCYQNISGQIIDKATGNPLQNITVINKNRKSNSTVTDSASYFKLSNIYGGIKCPPMTIVIENNEYKNYEKGMLRCLRLSKAEIEKFGKPRCLRPSKAENENIGTLRCLRISKLEKPKVK
jgi:hypothetical protein